LGLLERVVRARKHRPVFIIDLAVPRDVEPEVASLDDVFLYSVDDLAEIVKDNLQVRQAAVAEAEDIISAQSTDFMRWLEGRAVVPTIRALHSEAEVMRSAELEKAMRQLANGTPPEQVIEALSRSLTNKFMHAPTDALNRARDTERAELIALFQQVYKLER
jgi:glutamyl-tRNA reductase